MINVKFLSVHQDPSDIHSESQQAQRKKNTRRLTPC